VRLNPKQIVSLKEARGLIRRAIDKAEELKQRGPFIVVDEGGVPVSASRMDGAGPFGMAIVRGKAFFAAVNRSTSARLYERLENRWPAIYQGYKDLARDGVFPGQGAMLIRREGTVVGSLSTGSGIGPFMKFEGVDPAKLLIEGEPANAEDLIICYALREPYHPQHGDDLKRWMETFRFPPSQLGRGSGFSESPPANCQATLDEAIAIADAAIAEASRRGLAISVAVTDRNGDLLQMDRMDGAAPMSPDVAEALAVTAINFGGSSAQAAKLFAAEPGLARLPEIAPFRFLPMPGGIAIRDGGRIAGAVGVSGADPEENQRIAETAADFKAG